MIPPIATLAIADSGPGEVGPPVAFDYLRAVISQYANSPILLQILGDLSDNIDPAANLDAFYTLIWNVETAQGFGLDLWGRIVGVSRVLQVPAGTFFGFESSASAESFGHGIFYGFGSATSNFPLNDEAYRRLIMAKAAANITDGSVPAINAILTALFPDAAPAYVEDNGGMEMTYVFSATLSPSDYAIVSQSGALPKPAGVSFTVDMP